MIDTYGGQEIMQFHTLLNLPFQCFLIIYVTAEFDAEKVHVHVDAETHTNTHTAVGDILQQASIDEVSGED